MTNSKVVLPNVNCCLLWDYIVVFHFISLLIYRPQNYIPHFLLKWYQNIWTAFMILQRISCLTKLSAFKKTFLYTINFISCINTTLFSSLLLIFYLIIYIVLLYVLEFGDFWRYWLYTLSSLHYNWTKVFKTQQRCLLDPVVSGFM